MKVGAPTRDDDSHCPPSPVRLVQNCRNQCQTTGTHGELWIVRSRGTSSDHRTEETRPLWRRRNLLGGLANCLNAPELAAASNALRTMELLPFRLPMRVFVRHLMPPALRELGREVSANCVLPQPKPAENSFPFALISLAVVGCCRLAWFAQSPHNPKVVSSNLPPATMGACEANPLSALLIYSYEL